MSKFRVTIKYGNAGQSKNTTSDVTVEAGSEAVAMQLALNQFNSNSSNRNKEADVVKIKEL